MHSTASCKLRTSWLKFKIFKHLITLSQVGELVVQEPSFLGLQQAVLTCTDSCKRQTAWKALQLRESLFKLLTSTERDSIRVPYWSRWTWKIPSTISQHVASSIGWTHGQIYIHLQFWKACSSTTWDQNCMITGDLEMFHELEMQQTHQLRCRFWAQILVIKPLHLNITYLRLHCSFSGCQAVEASPRLDDRAARDYCSSVESSGG